MVRWTHDWGSILEAERQHGGSTLAQRHIPRNDHDGDTALREGRTHGDAQHSRHLVRLRNQFAVMAALCEEMLWTGFLKVAAADFMAGDLRRDGEDGHPAAVTVVEAVDQVQIPRTATAGADGQASGEMRFCASGKRRRLFMAHVHPSHVLLAAQRIHDAVKRVACDPVYALDSRLRERFHEHVRCFCRHSPLLAPTLMAGACHVRACISDSWGASMSEYFPCKWRHGAPESIVCGVRWYLRY